MRWQAQIARNMPDVGQIGLPLGWMASCIMEEGSAHLLERWPSAKIFGGVSD